VNINKGYRCNYLNQEGNKEKPKYLFHREKLKNYVFYRSKFDLNKCQYIVLNERDGYLFLIEKVNIELNNNKFYQI